MEDLAPLLAIPEPQAPPADAGESVRRPTDGALLEFLAPGVLHALGNHLFAIQGCAHVLKEGPAGKRQRATLLEATGAADQVLDVVRLLTPGAGCDARVEQAGVLLSRLAAVCRVPLRERGLRLEVDHSSSRRPRGVDARDFVRGVADLLRRLALRLPAFVEGTVRIDLADQTNAAVAIDVRIMLAPSCLPFPTDLYGVGRDVAVAHDERGVLVERIAGDGIRVRFPVAR